MKPPKTLQLLSFFIASVAFPSVDAGITINPFQYTFAEDPSEVYYGASVVVSGNFPSDELITVNSPNSMLTGYANGPYLWGYVPFSDFDSFKAELGEGDWTVSRSVGGSETVDTFVVDTTLLTRDLFGEITFTQPSPGAILSSQNPGTAVWTGPGRAELSEVHVNIFGSGSTLWDIGADGNQREIPAGMVPGEYTFGILYQDNSSSYLGFPKPESNGLALEDGILFTQSQISFTIAVPEPTTTGACIGAVLGVWAGVRRLRKSAP